MASAQNRGRGGGSSGGRGRGGGRGGRGGGGWGSHSSSNKETPEQMYERLRQSAAFVGVSAVAAHLDAEASVMAVAKPFASTNVYDVTLRNHVPSCEGQKTVQALQAALAIMYRNAVSIILSSRAEERRNAAAANVDDHGDDDGGVNAPPEERKGRTVPMSRRLAYLSVPLWMSRERSVVGTLDLLIYKVDQGLRVKVWGANRAAERFLSPWDIDAMARADGSRDQLDRMAGVGNDPPDAKVPEAVADGVANALIANEGDADDADVRKAQLLLSLSPLEAANYLIVCNNLSAFDVGQRAGNSPFVHTVFWNRPRPYFQYSGLEQPHVQQIAIDVRAIFSIPNALAVLIRRTGVQTVECTDPSRRITSVVDLINLIYGGPARPSETAVRELVNQRALAIAQTNTKEYSRLTKEILKGIAKLTSEMQEYVKYARRVASEQARGLVPQFEQLATTVRDYLDDMSITEADPENLVRVFSPIALVTASSAAHPGSSSDPDGEEHKPNMLAQREWMRERVMERLNAECAERHLNPSAHRRFQELRWPQFSAAVAVLGDRYAQPIENCQRVLNEVRWQMHPSNNINVPLRPMACIETCHMTASDNLLMQLFQFVNSMGLGINGAQWAVILLHMILATSLVKGEAQQTYQLSGGHAGGKTYTLRELSERLFGTELFVEVRTEAAMRTMTNQLLARFYDENDTAPKLDIKSMQDRRGMLAGYDHDKSTQMLKAVTGAQKKHVSKNDMKDPVTGQHRNAVMESLTPASEFGTSNHPTQFTKDTAMASRIRELAPMTSMGTTETHVSFLPRPLDDSKMARDWEQLRAFNYLMILMWHMRASKVVYPPEFDTGKMMLHKIVNAVVQSEDTVFSQLFSTTNDELGDDKENNDPASSPPVVSLAHALSSPGPSSSPTSSLSQAPHSSSSPLPSVQPQPARRLTATQFMQNMAQLERLRTNLLDSEVQIRQIATLVLSTNGTAEYHRRRLMLDQLVTKLHEGVSPVAFTRNDGIPLFTRRDTSYIRNLTEALEYMSATVTVFNNNAAMGNYTYGSLFERAQLIEDAHCDESIEHVFKGLQSCNLTDPRLIDGARALLALFCSEAARSAAPLIPDAHGIITIKNFFAPTGAAPPSAWGVTSSASLIVPPPSAASARVSQGGGANQPDNSVSQHQSRRPQSQTNNSRITSNTARNDTGGDGGERDDGKDNGVESRFYIFCRHLNRIFPRPIWESQMANQFVCLFWFLCVNPGHPLLDYRDFDDRSNNYDLRISAYVFLFGNFEAIVNTNVCSLAKPIETLGFHPRLTRDNSTGTFSCKLSAYTIEARQVDPHSLPPDSMWRQGPVTRETLYREGETFRTHRLTSQLQRSLSLDSSSSARKGQGTGQLVAIGRTLSAKPTTAINTSSSSSSKRRVTDMSPEPLQSATSPNGEDDDKENDDETTQQQLLDRIKALPNPNRFRFSRPMGVVRSLSESANLATSASEELEILAADVDMNQGRALQSASSSSSSPPIAVVVPTEETKSRLISDGVPEKKVAFSGFVQHGNNFADLRPSSSSSASASASASGSNQMSAVDRLPPETKGLLDNIRNSNWFRACFIFSQLIKHRYNHHRAPSNDSFSDLTDFSEAIKWLNVFDKQQITDDQRRTFDQRLEEISIELRRNDNERISRVNAKSRLQAERISRMAGCIPVTLPARLALSIANGTIHWLSIEHLAPNERPFFAPVPVSNLWKRLVQERARYAEYTLGNSQLLYENGFFLADGDLRHLEREQRLSRVYPGTSATRLWCSMENIRINQTYLAKLEQLIEQLMPVLEMHRAQISVEDDDTFFFKTNLPPDFDNDLRRENVHPGHADSASFFMDGRRLGDLSQKVTVGVFRAIFYELWVLFFEYMRWSASLQNTLNLWVNHDTCHFRAASLGLRFCTRIVDKVGDFITSPDLLNPETEVKMQEAVNSWLDSVLFSSRQARDAAVDALSIDQDAMSRLTAREANAIKYSVFVPLAADFPMTPEKLAARFSRFTDITPQIDTKEQAIDPVAEIMASNMRLLNGQGIDGEDFISPQLANQILREAIEEHLRRPKNNHPNDNNNDNTHGDNNDSTDDVHEDEHNDEDAEPEMYD